MLALSVTLIAILAWGLEDISLKISAPCEEKYTNLRISVATGLVMLIAIVPLLALADTGFGAAAAAAPALKSPWGLVSWHTRYLWQLWCTYPAFLFVPASAALAILISNIGLKYLDMSIYSPLENSSGGLPIIILLVYFYCTRNVNAMWEEINVIDIVGSAIVLSGVIWLAFVQHRLSKTGEAVGNKERTNGKLGAWAILFPLIFTLCDSFETVVCGIMLHRDVSDNVGAIEMCLLYCSMFALIGIGSWIALLLLNREWYHPFTRRQSSKLLVGLLETIAYCCYVCGMGLNPILMASVISSYCIISVILSRIILKERLKTIQYCCLGVIITGILLLGLSELME